MKRPSYHEACHWIAMNDNSGNGDTEQQIAAYISTQMVAEIWGLPVEQVANAISQVRHQAGLMGVANG